MAQRMSSRAQNMMTEAMSRMSSGLRINSAADDAAGIGISSGLEAQSRGFSQAMRNAVDGISGLQVADKSISSIVSMLQRVRELAVQANNGTNSVGDRASLDAEAQSLLNEVDLVAKQTSFNGIELFQRGELPDHVNEQKQFMVDQLYTNWLAESERMIEQHYGLKADGNESLSIVFSDDRTSQFAATVSYSTANDDSLSRATEQVLTIYTKAFPVGIAPDGGNPPQYSDRIIAHEMVHAVMGRTMDMDSLEEWFKEGTAELIHGGDENVLAQLVAEDDDSTNHFDDADRAAYAADATFFSAWDSSAKHYSQGYLAVRFLHDDIVANGGNGIKDVMAYLSDEDNLAAGTATLNNALAYLNDPNGDASESYTSYASDAAFKAAFTAGADAYIQTLNFSNEDTGAIGGLDVDGGEVKTAESVVDNSNIFLEDNPLEGYSTVNLRKTGVVEAGVARNFNLMLGPDAADGFQFDLFRLDKSLLGLGKVNLETEASDAITKVDDALEFLKGKQGILGSLMNRLESSIAASESSKLSIDASNSRIQDADFAAEAAKLSKAQILQQASNSILSQANSSSNIVLTLIG